MFDVSFSELLLILVVGLLVFGPEKLPEVIRTTSMWIAKIKRSFTQMRSEIEREMGVDELKRDLHNNAIMQNLRDVQNDLQSTQQELRNLPYDVSDVVQRANNHEPITHSAAPANTEADIHADPTIHSDPTIHFNPNISSEPSHKPALTTDQETQTEEPSSEHKIIPDNYSVQK